MKKRFSDDDYEENKSSDEDVDKFVYIREVKTDDNEEVIQSNYISDDHRGSSEDEYDDEESDESQNSL